MSFWNREKNGRVPGPVAKKKIGTAGTIKELTENIADKTWGDP
jgi:hypothetical protein